MTTNTAELRRCIGSTKFGIEAHEAPIEDFPKQPSQRDGLGRMCKPHWNEYTNALRKAAVARKAAEGEVPVDWDRQTPEAPKKGRRRAKEQAEVAQGACCRVDRATEARTRALGASPGPFLRGTAPEFMPSDPWC